MARFYDHLHYPDEETEAKRSYNLHKVTHIGSRAGIQTHSGSKVQALNCHIMLPLRPEQSQGIFYTLSISM